MNLTSFSFSLPRKILSGCILTLLLCIFAIPQNSFALPTVTIQKQEIREVYLKDVSRLDTLSANTLSKLVLTEFSQTQKTRIVSLEKNIVTALKNWDKAKTKSGKLLAERRYKLAIKALEKYLTSLSKKPVRTPNIRNPQGAQVQNSVNGGTNAGANTAGVNTSLVSTPDISKDVWSPDANSKILYYSDDFEGGSTSNGDEFKQSAFSAANCSASLNQLIQVRSGNEAVIVKVNDRPNCSKYPDIVDLSKAAFKELGNLQSGVLQGSFKKLGTIPASYSKEYLDSNMFDSLGIILDSTIPNMYLVNDTLKLTGEIKNSGTESLIYLVMPSGKVVSYGQDSEDVGRFEYQLPLTEVGKYDLVVASGRSFQGARPITIYVIDSSALAGKLSFNDPSKPVSGVKISSVRREAADLSPTHIVDTGISDSNYLTELTIQTENKKIVRSGFGKVVFSPAELKDVSIDSNAKLTLKGAKSSTSFSMDTIAPMQTLVSKDMKLVPVYGNTREVEYSSELKNGTFSLTVLGQSTRPIHTNAYIMRPSGKVDIVTLSGKVSGKVLSSSVGAKLQYEMNEEGTYLVEVNYDNGFAAIIESVSVGNVLAILPNEYDRQDKEMETNIAFARTQILKDINAIRQRAGLPALTFDSSMQQVADVKANDMASNNYVGHQDSNGDYALGLAMRLGIDIQGSIGENVAGGTVGAQYLQAGLSLSPGHRLNMLGEKWTKVGVSVVSRNGKMYVVEIFGE